MKAAQTLIVWNGSEILDAKTPPGSIAIGPLGFWAPEYFCSGGAAYTGRRKLFGLLQRHYVMLDWYMLVHAYGIDSYLTHRAFLLIDEYQAAIKDYGWGPAEGEPGHDPNTPYGRCVDSPPPPLKIFTTGPVTHFWPVRS